MSWVSLRACLRVAWGESRVGQAGFRPSTWGQALHTPVRHHHPAGVLASGTLPDAEEQDTLRKIKRSTVLMDGSSPDC